MNTSKYISARIAPGSMGSYLMPPNHPMHTNAVETDLERKKDNRGSMSLEYALTQEYVSPELKKKIIALLNQWELSKLPLTDPLVVKWIKETKKHFGENAAPDYIRKYYPDYK